MKTGLIKKKCEPRQQDKCMHGRHVQAAISATVGQLLLKEQGSQHLQYIHGTFIRFISKLE